RPETVSSPRVGWRLGRYLTVTVPPSTRTSGTFPSNRARYRSSMEPSTPIVRWAAPRTKTRRPRPTEPSWAVSTSADLVIVISCSSPFTSHRACLRQRHRLGRRAADGLRRGPLVGGGEGGQEALQDVDGH